MKTAHAQCFWSDAETKRLLRLLAAKEENPQRAQSATIRRAIKMLAEVENVTETAAA